jgi:hypothetical protein
MRVTKLIREYVEKSVKAIPKFKNLTPEEVAYKEMVKKVDEFRDRMNKELKIFLNTAIGEFCEAEGIPDDIKIEPTNYNTIVSNFCIAQITAKAHTAEKKRKNACNEAIDNILLSLELGADRKELDEMLKKLAE